MTTKEVAIMTGLSVSYINKVRTDQVTNLKTETINRVKFLLGLEVNFLDALFARPEFSDICTSVIERASERSHKKMVSVVRFANKCLRRHRTLMSEAAGEGFNADEVNAQELMGMYAADIKVMFKDELFIEMCSLAIKVNKSRDMRAYADFLLDISEYLRDAGSKKNLNDSSENEKN